MILLAAFIVYPVVMNVVVSFASWKGYGPMKWIGWSNYRNMLADKQFWTSLRNTGLMILYIPASTILTVLIAALLREGIRGWKAYRAILYVPNLLGYVLMGVIFSIYLRDEGPVNALVKAVTGTTIHFLLDPVIAVNTVGFLLVVWLHLGFGLIYFLAAMNGIDSSIYEAALIDGSGFWRTLFAVTIPSVRFALEFWVVFNFIEVFARMFPFIHTLTQGGPGFSTFTLEYGIYITAFSKFKVGYSSAWAVVLFVFCAFISVAQIRLMRRRDS
jgi:ABC-type sugar transport system permease subunit